jgi:hypothetical protein
VPAEALPALLSPPFRFMSNKATDGREPASAAINLPLFTKLVRPRIVAVREMPNLNGQRVQSIVTAPFESSRRSNLIGSP